MFNLLLLQAGVMAQSLFRVFDEDHSGKLTFYEYVQANNVKNLETPEDKLGWMFDAFDADGGGTVDVDEITNIVVGLFRLLYEKKPSTAHTSTCMFKTKGY